MFLVNVDQSLKIIITEVYCINKALFSNIVGSWTASAGLSMSSEAKLERRSNMKGAVLRARFLEETGYAALFDDSSQMKVAERNLKNVPWAGFVPDIFDSLAIKLNFSYELANSRDGKFGAINDNGEWNGLIKDLIDDEADIVPSALFADKVRATAVDFITPFQLEGCSFFIATQSSFYFF